MEANQTTEEITEVTPAMRAMLEQIEAAKKAEIERAAKYDEVASKPAAERTWS